MKRANAIVSAALALTLVAALAACTPRSGGSSSSSSAPSSSASSSSSMASSYAPSAPSVPHSEPGVISGLEDDIKDAASAVESTVTPTMSTDFDKIGALGTEQVPWGAGVLVDEQNRTTEPQLHQEEYGQYGAYFIAPADCGKFYLTFDEGYENGFTPQILDVLKEKGVRAVFFVTGDFVRTQPELVQRMIDEGHVVGNHTNRHKNPTQVPLEEAAADIRELHEAVEERFGYTMSLYRPPEGAFSEQTLAMVQQMGYTTCLWSFAYKDYDVNDQPDVETAYARTTKFIHEGAIYLLHAVSETNAAILGDLIDEVRARGLELAPWDLPYVEPAN